MGVPTKDCPNRQDVVLQRRRHSEAYAAKVWVRYCAGLKPLRLMEILSVLYQRM